MFFTPLTENFFGGTKNGSSMVSVEYNKIWPIFCVELFLHSVLQWLCLCVFPQSHGHWGDAHSNSRQQAWSAARSSHSQTQRIWLSPKKLEVWICGVLCQVQLARFTVVRRGSPQHGLCPLQARPCHHPFPAGAQERAMRPNVRTSAMAIVKRFMGSVWRWTLIIVWTAGRAVITLLPRNLTFGILTMDRQMWS